MPPQFREIVRLAAHPFLQPIYDLEAPRLAFGRAAILGDAAFVARPHVAAGVIKAAEDALALAAALDASADVEQALQRYEAERIGDWAGLEPANRRGSWWKLNFDQFCSGKRL